MKGLTTHILDLTHGQPASGVDIELYRLEGAGKHLLHTAATNTDGRLDNPLLPFDNMRTGEYELLFYIGDYFRKKGVPLSNPAFLDKVSVRIGLDGRSPRYHVPLLISPWGYQVYRGS
ncbi:hydroxyisourate hydrolase [Bacillus xiapuensis]|uniref:hydroxyisourate hydrolase n=1 Tax=Bacillus xiapuensis TaxID=2014075 RepID=UPI000C235E68|nr:hydroxyisourate hydrolase [Bacillus xiapuensis]